MAKRVPKKTDSHNRAGRPAQISELLPKLKKLGVFRAEDALKLGISQSSLARLTKAGQILRIAPGLYIHPDSPVPYQDRDFIVACTRFGPDSAVGGISALFYYGLIEQIPSRVWMVVPYEVGTRTASLYRCIRTQTDPKIGIDRHNGYRMTNLERTLVEAFRYGSKIGIRLAFHATRMALKQRRTTLKKIFDQATALGLQKYVAKHWEALVPESQAT